MSEFDKLRDVGAKQQNLPEPGARMRDVAVTACVSVATVSNVVNHPHLVAVRTRERVQRVIRELNFQPDPTARALRGLGSNIAEPSLRRGQDSILDSSKGTVDTPASVVADIGFAPPNSGLNHEILKPGNHLRLRVGPEDLSGIVDSVMPDKSCFWIWTDGGMGRRMIDATDVDAVGAKTSN